MAASDPRQSPGFRRRLLAARLFVWAERVWPAVWPAVGVAGLFLATSLLGLWYGLTTVPHAVLLALFAAGLAAALWRARQALRFSDRASGLARLERDSGVTHRPLRGLDDTLPASVQDPLTQRLWALHRERLVASLSRLRLSPPRSVLPARDPWALRAAVLLLLVVGLVDARGEYGSRLASAFAFVGQGSAAVPTARLDLWVTPPGYTHRAAALGRADARAGGAHRAGRQRGAGAAPPRGGGRRRRRAAQPGRGRGRLRRPRLRQRRGQAAARRQRPPRRPRRARPRAGGLERDGGARRAARGRLRRPAAADHPRRPQGRLRGHRRLRRGRGRPPARPRRARGRGRAARPRQAGQPAAQARLQQLHRPDGEPAGRARGGPQARGRRRRSGSKGRASRCGSCCRPASSTTRSRAPSSSSGASSSRDPATAPDVAGRLAALAETDTAQKLPTSVPLSLRVAASRLSFSQSPQARRAVIDLLWELALFIEDGALSVAERKLHDVQERLQKALLEGAKDAELEKMMQELQQALDEYLDQLTRQAQEQAQQPPESAEQQQQNRQDAQTVDRQDLQQMLDRAREHDAQRCHGRRRGRCWPSSSRCSRICGRHPAGAAAAFAGRAGALRPAEDDPAPAAAARPQLPDGPPPAGAGSRASSSKVSSRRSASRAATASRSRAGSRSKGTSRATRWARRRPSRTRCARRWAS